MQGLVIGAEPCYLHAVEPFKVVDGHVEVSHHEVGEVIASHLEEQLVLLYGVGVIDKHE